MDKKVWMELRAVPRPWRDYHRHYNRSPGHSFVTKLVTPVDDGTDGRRFTITLNSNSSREHARVEAEMMSRNFGYDLTDLVDEDLTKMPNKEAPAR